MNDVWHVTYGGMVTAGIPATNSVSFNLFIRTILTIFGRNRRSKNIYKLTLNYIPLSLIVTIPSFSKLSSSSYSSVNSILSTADKLENSVTWKFEIVAWVESELRKTLWKYLEQNIACDIVVWKLIVVQLVTCNRCYRLQPTQEGTWTTFI